MGLRWYTVVVDCKDVRAQGAWWAQVLGWQIDYEADDEVVVVPPPEERQEETLPPEVRQQVLVFVPVPEGKTVKNRLHLDLAPRAGDDHAAEVRRLLELGATRVDVGQGDDVSWVVLADPEGNEFCVLSPRDS